MEQSQTHQVKSIVQNREVLFKKGEEDYIDILHAYPENLNWRTAKKQLTPVGTVAGELGD